VLLPGDPLRARHIAQTFLDDVVSTNQVRGMLGFTGSYRGRPVTVQGAGMGVPSVSIYVNELIRDYGAQRLIRVGTCGALQKDLALGDVILAQTASTDSATNKICFSGRDFAPCADFDLLHRAWQAAQTLGVPVRVGNILTSDFFYHVDPDWWRIWQEHGVLATEMEAAALYTLAARHGVQALTVLTVSDQILLGQKASAEERQKAFNNMVEIALSLA